MKFSHVAVLALVAPLAYGFAPSVHRRQNAVCLTSLKKSKGPYDFDGLDPAKFPDPELTPAPAPKKAPKAKKSKAEPVPEPVPEPPEPKSKQSKKSKPAPAPAPAAPPKPDPVTAKLEALKAKATPSKPPKASLPKAPANSHPNAVPLGLALGGAPLLLAPFVALGATRDVLSKTQSRRSKIQEEITAKEAAAAARKAAAADVDASGVATALVRNHSTSVVTQFSFIANH